jgi:hypothetical protein
VRIGRRKLSLLNSIRDQDELGSSQLASTRVLLIGRPQADTDVRGCMGSAGEAREKLQQNIGEHI